MRITVAICTRNRAAQLRLVLTSVSRLRAPAGLEWEVCVVDNGSTDATRQTVESFVGKLPARYIFEPKAGLSNARNRAVAEARGEYICWTDDDVELDSNWLSAYAAAFDQRPEAAVFGGRILPRLQGPTPKWFMESIGAWPLQALLAARDFGDEEIPLSFEANVVPWGANFALRIAEQRQHPYDPNLGVSPAQRRLGEEAAVMFQILRTGAVGWWVPEAMVHHIIPPRRQSWSYIYEFFVAMGETQAYLEATAPGANFMWHGMDRLSPVSASSLVLNRRRARAAVSYIAARMFGSHGRAIDYLRQVGFFSGALAFHRAARN